jgi:hypothetical protein
METELYTVDDGTLLWFTGLKPAERKALDMAIASLVDLPEKDWPAKGAIRLALPKPTFMLKLGPSLRAFVRPNPGGKPIVQDFVNQETLDRYFKPPSSTKKAAASRRVDKTS